MNIDSIDPQQAPTLPVTLHAVGACWQTARSGSACHLWRFARGLLGFATANPETKSKELGAACASAVGRTAPYSPSWVSRALKAARATETEPVDPGAARVFLGLFHGNGRRASAKGDSKHRPGESIHDPPRWAAGSLYISQGDPR